MTIQTKYNVGDELYFIENNEIVKLKVSSINTSSYLQFESYVHVSLTYVFERPISSNSTNIPYLEVPVIFPKNFISKLSSSIFFGRTCSIYFL